MPRLIEHLAELTGFRDREQLDVTVVRAVNDVLGPLGVSVHRCVGEPGTRRWLTRARVRQGDSTITADPLWTEVSALPTVDELPARRECLERADVVTVGEGPQLNIFPIATQREVVGVFELETLEPLEERDRLMVCTILRIYGNFHDLLDHSEHDPLTGLLNRQTFDAAFVARAERPAGDAELVPQYGRARTEDTSVWLGVVDIDHFKRVNDSYGHLIGDEVLLLLARLLRSSFRLRDRLYRFGGEEFVVVLGCAEVEHAALAFERLRDRVERFAFPQVEHITVSIGFARTSPQETPSEAFSRADKALYHAKEHGRNQVVYFDDLVRAGLAVEAKIVGDIELF